MKGLEVEFKELTMVERYDWDTDRMYEYPKGGYVSFEDYELAVSDLESLVRSLRNELEIMKSENAELHDRIDFLIVNIDRGLI